MAKPVAPFWLTTRFGGRCFRCGMGIKKGEQALYYPASKTLLCQREPCGQRAQRDLDAEKFNRMLYGYRPAI